MKKMLPLLLATLSLAGCSKSTDTGPITKTPTTQELLVGNWTWAAERIVTTPKNGGAATTFDKSVTPGSVTINYTADGRVTTTSNGSTTSGSYTLAGTTLTITQSGRTSVNTITELTSTRQVTVSSAEDTANRYTVTDTFTR